MPNRSIGRYLALAAAALVGYKIVSGAYDASRNAKDKPKTALERFPLVGGAIGHLANEGGESPEQKHRRKEENYWLWTKVAAVVAAIGAVVAAAFAGGAFHQALRQADAAVDSSRPWIEVVKIRPDRMEIDDGKIEFESFIDLKNVGNSPARSIYAEIFLAAPGEKSGPEMGKNFCAEVNQHRKDYWLEDGIFPKDDISAVFQTSRSVDDVTAANEKGLDEAADILEKQGEVLVDRETIDKFDVGFIVLGCVSYMGTLNDTVHNTSFAYRLVAPIEHAGQLGIDISKSSQTIDVKKLGVQNYGSVLIWAQLPD